MPRLRLRGLGAFKNGGGCSTNSPPFLTIKTMKEEIEKVYYTVREAAKDVGVAPSSIRFWDEEYGIIKARKSSNNSRKITVKELMLFHKVKTLRKFMNKDGVKAVLDGDIQIKVNPEIL